ncbi:uncharacterized protein LOC110156955 isoform X2 [Boleophthalmus pectinirostris]|uniref:uncharacterized protein LOC110156955 isoform X2 n=1 Tax=Boleophthalmus pectinirostris TaxID=150288 RepID=UPI00242E4517|nr:uncharacterized protein LOC110156955 isoform X2 [Boleophthalmus pectinirostris]XP_055018536.1 uncharacterized protein LOC110156955 isoform X2 [Boleophthalmus pectinirostris]
MKDLVSSMSQVDKVLHLYVEVRTVDDKERLGEDHRSNLCMLQCPDVLPQSHRGFAHTTTNHSPDFSPKNPYRPRALSQSLPPSRCSSRHTVNFLLPQDDARLPTPASHLDTLYGSLGQLSGSRTSRMPQFGLSGSYSHYNDWGSHHKWGPEHSSPTVGRWSVPSTPTSFRRCYDRYGADDDNGTTSVVRYGYVEKASVNTANQRSSLCQYDTDSPFPENNIRFQKRNSDPGFHQDQDNCMFSNYRPVHKAQNTPTLYKRSTLEAVAKDATHRALREFGSPELKRRYESYIQENSGTDLTQHQQPQHCWSSSPSLHNKSPTLPSRCNQAEVTRIQGQTGVIAPHTSQHLSSTRASPSLSAHKCSPSLHQHYAESKQAKSYSRPHLPAGKPTDIQHTISTTSAPTNKILPMCSNSGQNNYNYNANNCKISNSTNQRHCNLKAHNVISPDDLRHFSSSYNKEKDSKTDVDGSMFSKSDRVKMCTSPVPSMDPPVVCSSTTKTFCCENQPNVRYHWQNSPVYVQPHTQTDKTKYRSPETMAGYRSPFLAPKSSSKSLSLPSSLNRTDLSHHPEMQSNHSVGFSNALKSENTVNHLYSCTEGGKRHHVSGSSAINSPEVTRRGALDPHQNHHLSVNRASRCEVYRREHNANKEQKIVDKVYTDRKEEVPLSNTPQTVCPINESSSSNYPSKVQHAGTACRPGPSQKSSSTGSQVGWKRSFVVPSPSWLGLVASIRCLVS